jgi:hypothetical protein
LQDAPALAEVSLATGLACGGDLSRIGFKGTVLSTNISNIYIHIHDIMSIYIYTYIYTYTHIYYIQKVFQNWKPWFFCPFDDLRRESSSATAARWATCWMLCLLPHGYYMIIIYNNNI